MTSWLRSQKKSELLDIAASIGLSDVGSLRKTDLESSLDEYLTERASVLSTDPRLAPYYNIRSKTMGSPVKREVSELRAPRRRQTKVPQEEIVAASEDSASTSTALLRTPARALSMASRIPLPASPADVASAVESSTVAVRQRVVSIYEDSGITEATQATRESLSTVYSIVLLVGLFEWYHLSLEILPHRYAFSIPAIGFLGTADFPVQVTDFSLLLTASFWSPALLWTALSIVGPVLAGFFFNLSAAHGSGSSRRGRGRASSAFSSADYVVDPLTFSVAKALLVFVVLGQGVTFGAWIDSFSVARIDAALYGGWKGALVGTAITGLASLYDAVLRK